MNISLDQQLTLESVVVTSYRAYDAAIAFAERAHHSPKSLKEVAKAARSLNTMLISVHEIRLASIDKKKRKK